MPTPASGHLRPHQKASNDNKLDSKTAVLGPTQKPVQRPLFHVEKQTEIDGVEMGVLENGVPYLTERGLARMCGIDRKVLNRLATGWEDEMYKPRGKQIQQLLDQSGYTEPALFLESEHNGTKVNAYTEPVCLALLEYYAFITDERRPEAVRAFRALARVTFRQFIYKAVGYDPEHKLLDSWQHFHDRIDMTSNAAPSGYWGVFKEIAVMIVPMIRAGIMISDKVVPDISVGRAWSDYWKSNSLETQFGPRLKYDHEYPAYYPQSKSNPQAAHAYPNAALGVFRDWLQQHYILTKFPQYLLGQSTKGNVGVRAANLALGAFGAKQLTYTPQSKRLAVKCQEVVSRSGKSAHGR